ncbi:uncharacterized protein MONBRDRAFT_18722 [Monosiga brevicollis MX1]|uniref:Uncharacterized protein n=1 Tax=Monosiga brevicollis TaxID=81824 RepID=A9UX43_MONBE|nr:uncharacterized protein MONBRDRAFT_18722 [Monosiga brevicollis MX1]EDQ90327.1 predicted protein [Monosiga brevicollis MX1]|eukprot:XP_001745094.1 hypothetical protein [Monosiga brevicollis MX1]
MPDENAHVLANRLKSEWRRQKAKGHDKASLTLALTRAFWAMFAVGGIFKFLQDTLSFVSPQLLKYLIRYVNESQFGEAQPVWHGYALAVGMFITAIFQSIFLHQYFHRVMKTGMRLRSAIINVVYEKSLHLSNTARQQSTTGEIVNLMSVDAQRFMDLMGYLQMIWSAPFQIALSLYFLWQLMGPSTLAGLGVMILMIPLNGVLAKVTRDLQKKIMKEKDDRIKHMHEILNGIKILKMYAWERPFAGFIQDIRNRELKILTKFAYLNAVSSFSWTAAPFLVSLVTFIAYTLSGNTLTAEKAFVSLSLFNILRFPMAMLPMMITSLVEATVSVNRLRTFLLHEETDPSNVIRDRMALALPAAVMERGEFSWNKTDVALRNIDLVLHQQEICMVVGRVGSGKSSLCSALLGDMYKHAGRVVLPGKVAYVPQSAWIRNATVRENILFGKAFDAKRYKQVIHACALEPDLLILPGGDACEIGDRGVNLSGGQKARVSLARAVYQDCDVYVLDDPLSAVDTHVASHIFKLVLGPEGMLRNKARLLVTNALQFMREAQNIVVMNKGEIKEQGTFRELCDHEGDFKKLMTDFTTGGTGDKPTGSKDAGGDVKELGSESTEIESTTDEQRTSSSKSNVILDSTGTKGSDSALMPVNDKTDKAEKSGAAGESATEHSGLIKKEKAQEGNVKLDVYMSYFRAITWPVTISLLAMYVVSYGMQVGSNKWLDVWSSEQDKHDHAVSSNATQVPNVRPVGVYLGVYAALGMGNALGVLFTTLVLAYGSIRASRVMHNDMLLRIVRCPMSFFDTTPLGRIVNRFSKDIYVLDETIPRSLRSFMSTFMQVVATIVVISVSTPLFMVIILPMSLLYYYVQRYYVATSRQLQRLESVSRSPIYAHFTETLHGVSNIRAYGKVPDFVQENEERVDFNLQAYYPFICANRWLALRLEFLGNSIIFFAALFAVIEVEEKSSAISPGTAGLSLSYAMSVTQTLNWMVRMSSQLETDIVAIERVEEYCSVPVEAPPILDHRPKPNWPDQGNISFDHYCVRYREGLDLVLREISCTIEGGQKIGCVGRTGAGKSSMTLSLLRILEAAGGRIVIDGENIAKIGLEDLRSRLTIMPQDPIVFSGTIRQNLDPFKRHTDDELWRALRTCHLGDKVTEMEGALDHVVSEGGGNFSLGERQLLCLSRAVLRKTKVLILDEATAAVDVETDELIQETIRSEFAECTIFTIAHRLNTIMDSDKIMVLDKGKVIEFDSPAALLATRTSVFYGMAESANLI